MTLKKENEKNLIVGCCNETESITYGPIDEIFNDAHMTKSMNEMENLLDDYVMDFKKQCVTKKISIQKNLQTNIVDEGIELLGHTGLSRSDIKTWARNNYNKTSPTSAISASYYDFSQISGAYDCTNFVSHALAAGGATLHDDGENGITGTSQWYFRSSANRSSSWAGVNQLYSFLTRSNPSVTNIGPYAVERTRFKKSLTEFSKYVRLSLVLKELHKREV